MDIKITFRIDPEDDIFYVTEDMNNILRLLKYNSLRPKFLYDYRKKTDGSIIHAYSIEMIRGFDEEKNVTLEDF